MNTTIRIVALATAIVATAACGGSGDASEAATITAPASTGTSSPSTTTTTTTTRTAATTTAPTTTSTVVQAPASPTIRSLVDSGQFVRLAHAGGDQDAPHSTMFAFRQAVAAGTDALELDVQLTADNVLVVQHDDTVDKTTEATGPVTGLTLAELQALDNAYWFSPECWPCQDRPVDEYIYRGVRTGDRPAPEGFDPDDFRVPTFREIATTFSDLPLDIEIKGALPGAADTAAALADELAELGREDSVVVVSFDDEVIDVFHELAPNVAVSPGLGRLTAWFLGSAELEQQFEILQLPPFQSGLQVITADVVRRIHDEGRIVWVWPNDASTQENAEFYAELVSYGVDGVIAGRPAALASVV